MRHVPPTIFILPEQPRATDKRPRTAFGFLKGFGAAYAAHYRKLDKSKTVKR